MPKGIARVVSEVDCSFKRTCQYHDRKLIQVNTLSRSGKMSSIYREDKMLTFIAPHSMDVDLGRYTFLLICSGT